MISSTQDSHSSVAVSYTHLDVYKRQGEELLDAATTESVLITPADNYAVSTITNHMAEVKQIFQEELENILIGEQTPQEGMENAKTRSDAILQQ